MEGYDRKDSCAHGLRALTSSDRSGRSYDHRVDPVRSFLPSSIHIRSFSVVTAAWMSEALLPDETVNIGQFSFKVKNILCPVSMFVKFLLMTLAAWANYIWPKVKQRLWQTFVKVWSGFRVYTDKCLFHACNGTKALQTMELKRCRIFLVIAYSSSLITSGVSLLIKTILNTDCHVKSKHFNSAQILLQSCDLKSYLMSTSKSCSKSCPLLKTTLYPSFLTQLSYGSSNRTSVRTKQTSKSFWQCVTGNVSIFHL